MKLELPEKVKKILDTLIQEGYEAYAVGGCVRDSILGRNPQDWDITTSATPKQVKEIFPRTIDTGIEHGTVTVMLEKEGFEVTTYRIDGKYEDARHPKEVTFTRNLTEDLKRRDFTINAMAYNEEDGLVDLFDGMGDMERKVIRCVGEPKERFAEDALRMMRAVRFGAQLGFSIDEKTIEAIKELAPTLKKISAERIQTELVKLLVSPHPEQVEIFYETGISKEIFPWLDRMMHTEQNNVYHCYNVGKHTIETLKYIQPEKVLRLTMLLHDVAKPECQTIDEEGIYHFKGHAPMGAKKAEKILRGLKFDNDTITKVSQLILHHDDRPPVSPKSIRRAMYRIGLEQFPALFFVKKADLMGKSDYLREETFAYIQSYQREYERILESQECVSLKTLAVSGSDLIAMGMKQGKEIGETLQYLLEIVLENPQANQKEILLGKLKEREF